MKDNLRLSETSLPEIDDEGTILVEVNTENCRLVQAAQFHAPNIMYKVNALIWDKLSTDQKAILLFHELIYTEAAVLGHVNSTIVRSINRAFFTNSTDHIPMAFNSFLNLIVGRDLNYRNFQFTLLNTLTSTLAATLLKKIISMRSLFLYCNQDSFRRSLESLINQYPHSFKLQEVIDEARSACGYRQY